jgi:hypothetical protein
MNPTTTTPATNVLSELARREQKLERARAEAQAAGVAHKEIWDAMETIQVELNRLYEQNPEDFDHQRLPLKASSPAGKLHKQLAELDDLGEAQARYDHA